MKTLNKIHNSVSIFKLLADPTRCKILLLLFKNKDGMCVYEIADELGITHSAVSHQLSRLERENVLESYREGQMVCYMLSKNTKAKSIIKILRYISKL